VTLLGAGPVEPGQLAEALAIAPDVVAADGGGDVALPAGHRLAAVIGDMDSLADPGRLRAQGVPLYPIAEQDSTDLQKCLRSVAAPLFVGLGFLGGRIDHHLAAMNALVRFPELPVVMLGGEDLCLLCPPRFEVDLAAGTRVSLFPMGPVRGIASRGLRWPIDGLAFDPEGRIGTSNAATGGVVRLEVDAPRMLLILPAGTLAPVVDRIRGAPAGLSRRWPPRSR
jgi:thiamine pyrophosphokinase